MERYDYIDSLRGFAVLGVIMVHSTILFSDLPTNWLTKIFVSGRTGVSLFFIISAFTIVLSMERRKENFQKFYLRRIFRIAPLYYALIPIYLLLFSNQDNYWLGDMKTITSTNILSHYLFINGFNPYWINSVMKVEWSISVEVLFYLIIPIILYFVKDIKSALILTGFSFLFEYGIDLFVRNRCLISDERLWNDYLNIYFPSQLPIFLIGICTFMICKNGKIEKKIAQKILILSLIGLLILSQKIILIEDKYIYSLFFSGIVISLNSTQPNVIVNNLFSYIGKISYSAYLTHWISIEILKRTSFRNSIIHFSTGFQMISAFILVVLITIMLSSLTYNIIELPAIKFGSKVIRMMKTKKTDIFAKSEET